MGIGTGIGMGMDTVNGYSHHDGIVPYPYT